MRLSDLMHAEVLDPAGRRIGLVNDVRLRKTGPRLGQFGAALQIDGLIIGGRTTGSQLGYERSEMHGPWLLQTLMSWVHRNAVYAEWQDVASIRDRTVRLRRGRDELGRVPML
ncbi:MAG: hypothetical protein ABR520_10145 [Mycobacteriales bacterium]|nr:hypothetical protein [Frankia sp.]